MKVKLTVTQILAAKLDEVLVMGEEKNLSAFCQGADLTLSTKEASEIGSADA